MPTFSTGYEFFSLNAATGSNVVGAAYAIPPGVKIGQYTTLTGSPTSGTIDTEISNDGGVTWFFAQSQNLTSGLNWSQYINMSSQVINGTLGATHIRARLVSFTGGTSPTATVLFGTYLETQNS